MPVPKMKVSRSRRNKRSANKNIKMGPVGECQTCKAPLGSHRVCKGCGYYKGTKILKTKFERSYERNQARMAHAAAAQPAGEGSQEPQE